MAITRTFYLAPLPEGKINIRLIGAPVLDVDKKGNQYYSVPFKAEQDVSTASRHKLLFTDRDMDLMFQALSALTTKKSLDFAVICGAVKGKTFPIWQHIVKGDSGTFYNWYYSEESYQKAIIAKTATVTTDEELASILSD